MIKVCRGLYIHFTLIFLIAVCYINRNLETMAVSYITIFFHELIHLVAALIIGLKPARIVLFPFGVNLKLKNTIIYSLADEIILYMSGPVFNAVISLLFLPFIEKNEYFKQFYYCNIALFIFNILPIVPMDGGTVLKKILNRGVGERQAEIILKTFSIILIGLLFVLQVIVLIKSKFNFSILFAVVFLMGNLFTNKEKYYLDFTKELMFYKIKDKKKIKKVKGYLIKPDSDLKELVRRFTQSSNYVIFKENYEGRIDDILTEREIVDKILK